MSWQKKSQFAFNAACNVSAKYMGGLWSSHGSHLTQSRVAQNMGHVTWDKNQVARFFFIICKNIKMALFWKLLRVPTEQNTLLAYIPMWPILQWWNVTVNATWFKFSADLYNQSKQCLFNSTYNLKEYYKSIRTVLVITNILICFIN